MTCAIYCRLSREDAEKIRESESIQNQKAMLAAYAASQGWEVGAVYCDEDYSGADRDRPGWNAMLSAAERREFQIVLCKTQSRFTRDMELVEKYLHGLFPLWGVRFVAVVDHVDTDLKGNKTVSYTHLDVYKRQHPVRPGARRARILLRLSRLPLRALPRAAPLRPASALPERPPGPGQAEGGGPARLPRGTRRKDRHPAGAAGAL